MENVNEISANNQEVAELEEVVVDGVVNEETQEVVEPVIEENVDNTVDNQQVPPVVETKPRDYHKDSSYAKIRREKEQAEKDVQRLMQTLNMIGFDGRNVDDLEDQANAHYYGRDVEDVRNERIKKQEAENKYQQMEAELQMYRNKDVENRMNEDLKAIQAINPNVKSLGELGTEYFDLISKGVDGVKAYKLLNLDELANKDRVQAEQKALNKIIANQETVGPASSEPPKPKTYSEMSDDEFEVLIQKAKRGELKG